MPNEDRLVAAGGVTLLGKRGRLYDHVGQIWVSQAAMPGVDTNLWACLQRAVDMLRLAINIDAVDAGPRGPATGCREGRAVAINRVGTVHKKWHAATLRNPQAVRLAEYLLAHGFQAGEDPRHAALLFGPTGSAWNSSAHSHAHHLSLTLPPSHRTAEGCGAGLAAAGCPLADAGEAAAPITGARIR